MDHRRVLRAKTLADYVDEQLEQVIRTVEEIESANTRQLKLFKVR